MSPSTGHENPRKRWHRDLMEKTDPYVVLGVRRSASQQEIKSAFRNLARCHHPDVTGNAYASTMRFVEIAEAYEVLGNAGRRHEYDLSHPDHAGTSEQFTDTDEHWVHSEAPDDGKPLFGQNGHVFDGAVTWKRERASSVDPSGEDASRGGNRWTRSVRGADSEYDLRISFRQAYKGVSVDVTTLDRKLEVRVPPGVDTGTKIRVPRHGAPGLRGGPPGDLFLKVTVLEDPYFLREGNNIHMAVPLKEPEARVGATIEFPGPGSPIRMTIPAGTKSNTCFRLKGLGFPSPYGELRGDAYVTVHVTPR